MTHEMQGRVLVLSDPGAERDGLLGILESAHYDVHTVDRQDDLVAEAVRWSPSVILIEVDTVGDLAVIARLKADSQGTFLPVLLTTSRREDDALVSAGLAAGGSDFVFKPFLAPVLLARLGNQLSLYEAQVKLRQLVITDDLTGVFSRRFLFESMRHLAKQISRGGPPVLSCLMIDIDHFKQLNAEVGLVEADRVLKTIAQIIRRTTRDSDIVARFGGEEFAVILPSTGGGGARVTAEKIRLAVERDKGMAPVTVSIGVSWCELPTEIEAQSLLKPEDVILNVLKKADTALFRAKSGGRNRVVSQSDLEIHEPSGGVPILLEVRDARGRHAYYSTELASTGVAIGQDPDLEVGDELELCLHLDEQVVPIQGRVVWTGPVIGVGMQSCIAFSDIASDTREGLEEFIRTRSYDERLPDLKAERSSQ